MESSETPSPESTQLTKAERKRLRRAEKELRREQEGNKRKRGAFFQWGIGAFVVLAAVGWLTYKIVTSPRRSDVDVVSRQEIHWHAMLDITIRGQKIDIPANIGIPTGDPTAHPQNMHTHDTDHVIHIEKFPPVYKTDLRLANFFQVWGKKFSSQCVVDECVKEGEKITMTVNGRENTDFENYLLQDGDRVEIVLDTQ